MRKNYKKFTALVLAGVLAISSGSYGFIAAPTAGMTSYTSNIVTSSTLPTAGVSLALAESVLKGNDVIAAVEENDTPTVTAEAEKLAVAKVNDYVNIRKKPNEDSKVLGKLYSDCVGTVLGEKNGWYKIKSGTVEGYVKSEYVVVGDEDLLKSVGTRIAVVDTETLKVRAKADGDAEVLTLVAEGEELRVVNEKNEDWVKVKTSDGKGFVSADYVVMETEYQYAESKAEEEARLAAEAAEEAARLAAQEAERLAAQQQVANNNSVGSTSSSSSRPSSSVTYSDSTSTSRSGQAVANYACQFVGNPYVWGGTSLTHGADCSGFVMSVYAHFGVSLPHSSYSLRGVGRAVSASEGLQPGDIICYNGHVAIYIGGGSVVHASNPSSGIKISSPYNYRGVVAIRRIF